MRAREELEIKNKAMLNISLMIDAVYSVAFLYFGMKYNSIWNTSVGAFMTF